MLTVLYIAGHARSGSSAFESWLQSAGVGRALGEVRDVFRFACDGLPCGCGEAVSECPFWSAIVREVPRSVGLSLTGAADVTDEVERFSASLRRPAEEQYVALWSEFWRAIELAGCTTVIDNSKSHREVRRRLVLMQKMPVETRPILLERGRSATAQSAKTVGAQFGTGAPFRSYPVLHQTQSALAWFLSNTTGALGSRAFEDRTLCGYEELDDDRMMSIVGKFGRASVEPSDRHFIGGNRHRFNSASDRFTTSHATRSPSRYARVIMGARSRDWLS